jgi:hypothetical protein
LIEGICGEFGEKPLIDMRKITVQTDRGKDRTSPHCRDLEGWRAEKFQEGRQDEQR